MFGTVGRLKVKPGKLDELLAQMEADKRKPDGEVGFWLYKVEGKDDELILAVAFKDKETYFKNADDPAQDEMYRAMVALLQGPPTWEDGHIVASR